MKVSCTCGFEFEHLLGVDLDVSDNGDTRFKCPSCSASHYVESSQLACNSVVDVELAAIDRSLALCNDPNWQDLVDRPYLFMSPLKGDN